MTQRLQVLLEETEMRELRRAARARKMTVAEWVRQALRAARRQEPDGDAGVKLAAIRRAARHGFPTADVAEMLADIERGYASRTTT
jgi:Asp-tRNA(Asn)/Glu-tRNA(Gln) amidotransferase A subunit family amidase